MGNKLSCACGNTKRKFKVSSKLSKSKKKIENVKGRQPDIVKNLGGYDLKIVDDQIRDAEKQSKELTTRVEKLVLAGSATDQNVQDFNMKIDVILSLFEATYNRIAGQDNNVTYHSSDAQDRLTELKNLEDEIKKEENTITQLNEQGSGLLSTFAPDSTAHQQIKQNLSTVFNKYSEILENVATSQNKWNQCLNARKVLQKNTEEVNRWLQNKESDLERFLVFGMTKQDVERQKKSSQKLIRDNDTFHSQLKALSKKGREVGEDCCSDSKAELLHQLSVLESRYSNIRKQARTNSKDLGYHLDLLCKFQSKSNKLKTWCNETEMKCSTPLHLDCATSILRDQYVEYQKLYTKIKEHCEQLPTLQLQSEKLQMRMSDDDKEKADQQMKSLAERTTRIDHLIFDRLDQLESVLSQQDEVDGDIQSLSHWLESMESLVTPLKSIGNSTDDAKKLQRDYKKLSSEFKTKELVVAKLNTNVVKLTDSGQTSNLDTIQRILTKFSLLNDQVVQMQEKCLNAVSIRQQYATRVEELQTKLDQCRQKIDKTKQQNIPVTEKLDQYKGTYNELQEIERSLNLIVETAHQIDLESSNGNGHCLSAELKNLQAKINSLKMTIDQEIQDCERKDLEGKEISKSLDEMLQWLELRCKEFTTLETLDLNLDKLKYTFQKQEQLFQEGVKRVNMVKTSSEQLQKAMGDDLKQKLVQVENLHEKTKSAYKQKEKYISDAMVDRNQLELSIKQVTAWVNGAEKLLECRSVNDSDHQNLHNQLEEIKEYLSEASLCQDEMEIITEMASRIVPSLDDTDKMTLEKSVKNIKGRQESVMTALQDLQDKMEARIDQWNEFHGLMQDFETIMPDLLIQWSEIINGLLFTDPNQILQSCQTIEDFVKCLDANKPLVDKINKYSKELDIPKSDKESYVYLAITSVNDQWNSIKTQTQDKLRSLADISSHWECVNIVITEMDVVLQEAEQSLLSERLTVDPACDDDILVEQIERIEIITQNLKPASAGIISLKESADTLLRRLPTAEAKVHSQDQLLLLNERYERLAEQCQTSFTLLLEENHDRKSITLEIEQTMEFLEDTQVKLYNLTNSSQDGKETDVTRTQKKMIVEIDTRLNHIYSLIKIREAKYQNVGVVLPASLVSKLDSLKTMQKNLQKLMTEQENVLQHLGKDRQTYKELMDEIRDWLTEAYLKLKRRIKDVDEDIIKHREFLLEFDSLKSKLASVRSVGEQLIQNSPDSIERQKVQYAIVSLNKRHAALQSSAANKTQQLEEAQTLLFHFNEAANDLECWFDQAEKKTNAEIGWNDFDVIKQQFQIYKELSSELVRIQIKTNHLNSNVKHLKQTCDANEPLARVSAITQRLFNLNGKVASFLSILEDANVRISNFESHLMSLREFLLQTKQNQQLSEPNLTIQDNLLLHQKILDDITRQRSKVDNIVKQLPSQMHKIGFQHPEYVILMKRIDELYCSAQEHQQWLCDALQQEESNKMEIQQLKYFVNDDRSRLTQSFTIGSDTHTLQKDLAENSAIFDQLKYNKERLKHLKEQNRMLSKMAISKQSVIYGQHFPIQSRGVPQISTSTPRKEMSKDSGVSFSSYNEKSSSCPFLFDTLSEISWSPSILAASNSLDELDKTVCQPAETKSNQIKGRNQTQSKSTKRASPSSCSRNVQFRRSQDWRNEKLGVRRQLFDLHSTAATSDIALVSQSLPDIREDFQWNRRQSDQPSSELVIQPPCFKVPNMVSPELNVSIQRISSKLNLLHTRFAMQAPMTHSDLQHNINEHKDLMKDLDKIKRELNGIHDLEKSKSHDPQRYQAMSTTLSLLTERIQQLEAEADDRYKILQEMVKLKEEHFKALKEYIERFATMEKWLQEKQEQLHSSESLIGQEPSVESLLQETEENKQLQASVHQKMKELSDMAVQCDRVCELEPYESAEAYHTKLVKLQKNLSVLKLNIVKNLNSLSQAVKGAQAKQRAPTESETDMKSIGECINRLGKADNKEDYFEKFNTSGEKINDKQKKKLDSDFSKHKKLFETISTNLVQRSSETSIQSGDTTFKPADNTSQEIPWKSLHSRVLQSKQLLLDRGQAKPLALHFSSARYFYNSGNGTKDEKSLTQTRHVEQSLANLNDRWKETQSLPAKDPQVFAVNEELKKLLVTLSDWLDHFETRLFTVPPKNSIQQKLKENEVIRKSINEYQEKMKTLLAPISGRLNQTLSENDSALMNDSVTQVKDRMLLLTSQIEIHAGDMNTWKRYEEKITKLKTEVTNISNKCNTRDSEECLNTVIEQMENIESQLKELEINLYEFKSPDEDLDLSIPNWVVSEFTNVQMAFMDAKRQIMDKKANHLKNSSIHSQYEKILKDYADFLMTAENKLKTKKVIVRDFDHLKQQLGADKEFFSDMESYRVLLDSLVKDCNVNVCKQHEPEHTRLSNLTDHVQDLANLHGQYLNSYVNQWSDFNTQSDKIMSKIKEMEKQCHSLSSDLDSGGNLSVARDTLKSCQEMQDQLTPEVFQVLNQGKEIQRDVNSLSLNTQITSLADRWSKLHSSTCELSESFKEVYEQIEQYKNDAAIWSTWLESSTIDLATLRNLQEDDAQNISVIRKKMEKLLEFRKERDNEASMKNKLILVGTRLQHSHSAIAEKMGINVDRIEEQWAELKHDIDRAEQALHQAQMELLPSRQALNELIMFLDKLNRALQEDKNKTINKLNKITPMLNKYKKFKIEMENKALMMDFVNQCILKPNDKDDSASSLEEKNDFAKRLSKLQQDWANAEEDLNDQLNRLSAFQEEWEVFEQCHKNLANCFLDMEEKMKKRDWIGSEVTVKHSIKECQALQEKAIAKEADIGNLKTLGNKVLEFKLAPTGSQKIVKERVESMQKKWQAVCKNLQQQEGHLQEVLRKWVNFSSEKALILDLLDKFEYYLSSHANFRPGNYHLLKMHLSKMKVQSEEIEQESNKLENLAKLSMELSQVCDGPIKQDLDKTTKNIQYRWQTLTLQLKEHCELLEEIMKHWKVYNEKYQAFCKELSQMEKSLEDMMFNYDSSQLEKYWAEIQDLLDKLDIFQSKLSELYQLSDEMRPNLDTVSEVNINSQLATLGDRLLQLRHSADRFYRQMTDIRLQFNTFEQSLKTMNSFLERAETIIQNTNIQEVQSLSAEEAVQRETLMKFKGLLAEFHINATLLDSLNELGYRMALDEDMVQRMQDLNQRWNQVHSHVIEHCQCLQNNVLLHQNFTEKCASWMTHLAEIENILAEDIGGCFEELVDEQKKYQTLTSELANKQQLLHAIVGDGQRMQTVGDATDSDFEHNLVLLSTQWQNVTKRINERKTMVDTLISTWKNFDDQILGFDRWLEDKHTTLRALDIDMASMRCKRNIMEKVKNIENEFKMQDERYNSILGVSHKLLQYTRNESKADLLSRLKQLQYKRTSVIRALDLQMSKLQTAVKQWELCDEQVEELLAWLRDTHHVSWKPMPTSYEELETELHRCQDLQVSCSIYEDRYQEVFENVNQLNHVIQPEDVSHLQQRMKLWHKQWTELCGQIEIRILQIKDSLRMWPQYITDVHNFCIWCEQMEAKVRSMNGYNIETMLAKFEKKYECDLNAKEKEKDSLMNRAEALQSCSSKVRSSDIAFRVNEVEHKWQHLQTIVSNRKHKLKETLQAMQQFDRDTANLRKWLEQMENKLQAPPVYVEFDYKEIEKHVQCQKDLQKDIERHSAGVSSVLNLCEVLLHDSDACRTNKESAALSNTKNTLEKRWQAICKVSSEREAGNLTIDHKYSGLLAWRVRQIYTSDQINKPSIQETWKLWQSFMTDNGKFTTWLDDTEKALQKPDDSFKSKNSQSRFYQDLQRKISEKVNQLENLKKQYDVLVKGGRTDTSGSLERKVREANNRWEELSRKVNNKTKNTSKNAVSWEEYHVLHKTLLKWLRNVDSRIKEFEKADNVPGKSECLKKIQEEQMSNNSKFIRFKYVSDQLLIDDGDTRDSRFQIEVDDFYDLHDWVIGRLNSLLLPDDKYPNDIIMEEDEIEAVNPSYMDSWTTFRHVAMEPLAEVEQDEYREIETYLKSSPPVSPHRQRRVDIPYSVNKEEWRLRLKEELAPTNKENLDAYNEEMLNVLEDCAHKLIIAEEALRCHTPVGPEIDYQTSNYIKIMSDCQASVENVQRVYTKIKNDLGLTTIVTMEQEVSNVTNRWTRLRSCIIEKDLKMEDNRKDWSQFNTDLDNTNKWLSARENWLKSINVSDLEIAQMGGIIKELKDFQEEVKSKQAIVESLKLTGVVFCEGPLKENQLAKCRLQTMNTKWKQVTARCEHLVGELRKKLSQSDYFHEEVERLLVWMNQMEAKVQEHQPHSIDEKENNVQWQYDSLQSLKNEIKQQQQHISALKETSRHLESETISPRVAKSKDNIHIISAKAHSLLQQIMTCLSILESRLDFKRKPVYQSGKSQQRRILSPFHFIRKLIYGDVSRSGPSSSPLSSSAAMADSDTTHDENADEVDGNSLAAAGAIGIGLGQVYNSKSSEDSYQTLKAETVALGLRTTGPEVGHFVTSSVDVERKPPTLKQRKEKIVPPKGKGGHIVKDDVEPVIANKEIQGTDMEPKPLTLRQRKKKRVPPKEKSGHIVKDDIETLLAGEAKQETSVDEEGELDTLCEVSDEDEIDAAAAGPCSCSSFCRRAFWIALPIQALLLLLLGLASLLPMTEEDYSCALTNNMQRSFTSVLHYVDGPPPV